MGHIPEIDEYLFSGAFDYAVRLFPALDASKMERFHGRKFRKNALCASNVNNCSFRSDPVPGSFEFLPAFRIFGVLKLRMENLRIEKNLNPFLFNCSFSILN